MRVLATLSCTSCSRSYSADDPRWRCDCGSLLDLQMEPSFPTSVIAGRPPSLWRYREAIPLDTNSTIISLGEGMTPLIEETFDGLHLLLKLDYLSPSGSFKDRGTTVMISKLRDLGVTEAVEDSSGNAGSAIALYCARAGIRVSIYVPASASTGKLSQMSASGAEVHRIEGTREDVAAVAFEAAKRSYYASHSWNPFFVHGTKTFAFEICEQLGWQIPDAVVSPVGNGTLLLGIFIGFSELRSAGIIDHLPILIGVQSEGCAPIHTACEADLQDIPSITRTPTIAEGIAIAQPVRGQQILRAIRETGGLTVAVTEPEILNALRVLCLRGFYVEPTAAVALAGAIRIQNDLRGNRVIVPLTGSGLKAGEQITKMLERVTIYDSHHFYSWTEW